MRYIFRWGGYLWPRHLAYVGLAIATWFFLQADLATTRTPAAGWILVMLGRNVLLMITVFGFYHLTLYVWKLQGTRGKYHPSWQQKGAAKFLFHDQVKDNMFWSIVSGATIWTAWEVLYVWMAGNGFVPLITLSSNPIWFVSLFLLIPLWRETHFYFVHRLLHWKPLLRAVHSLHHKNPNPGPWSGMSMHPVEHILYLSVVLIHFVVPSHPIHMLYNAQLTALTPAQGHTGFEGPLFGRVWPAGDYFHYLHHKYVSCNFGAANVPWDRLLGRYHDGEGTYRTKG
ncbi:MAG: sterol desaturase family protein [Spirochaetota bacterium]